MFPFSKKPVHVGNWPRRLPKGGTQLTPGRVSHLLTQAPGNGFVQCPKPACPWRQSSLVYPGITDLFSPKPIPQQPYLAACCLCGLAEPRLEPGPLWTPHRTRTRTLGPQRPPHRRRCDSRPAAGMATFPPEQFLHWLLHTDALVWPGWSRGLFWCRGCEKQCRWCSSASQTSPHPSVCSPLLKGLPAHLSCA